MSNWLRYWDAVVIFAIIVVCIALLAASCGALVYWLVSVMALVAVSAILPGRDIFTCPKCGNVAQVKMYKAKFDSTVGVQKDPGEKED